MFLRKVKASKVISFLLSMLIVLSTMMVCSLFTFADANVVLSVDNVSGTKGSQVDVKVNITANSNMAAGSFNIEYDPTKLTVVSGTAGSVISGSSPNVNKDFAANKVRVNWAGLTPITAGGTVVTVKFQIKTDAATGSTPIALKNVLLINKDGADVSFTQQDGSVNVQGPSASTVLSVDNVSGSKGSQVDVKVNITENSNMAAGSFNIEYDPAKLTVVSGTAGSAISGASPNVNTGYAANKVRVNWAGLTPITAGGTVVTVKFQIKSDAAIGNTPVVLKNVLLINKDGADVAFNQQDGSVNITDGATPLVMTGSDPADGATNVPVNKLITVQFNRQIQDGAAFNSISLKDSSGNSLTITKATGNNVLSIISTLGYAYNRQYILTIPANAVKDTNGVGLASETVIRFTTVAQTSGTKIIVSSTSASNGKTVDLTVSVKDIVGLAGGQFRIKYDPNIAVVKSVQKGAFISDFVFTTGLENAGSGIVRIGFSSAQGTDGTGELCKLSFEIKGSTGQTTDIVAEQVRLNDIDDTVIPVTVEKGVLTVAPPVIYGDVSGDGEVTAGDATLILRYIVGSTNLNANQLLAADVSGDGEVTAGDATLILRYIVGSIIKFPVEH